jgi:hypothetical protein
LQILVKEKKRREVQAVAPSLVSIASHVRTLNGSVIFALDIFPEAPLQNLGGFSECYGCVRVAATTQSEEDPI